MDHPEHVVHAFTKSTGLKLCEDDFVTMNNVAIVIIKEHIIIMILSEL